MPQQGIGIPTLLTFGNSFASCNALPLDAPSRDLRQAKVRCGMPERERFVIQASQREHQADESVSAKASITVVQDTQCRSAAHMIITLLSFRVQLVVGNGNRQKRATQGVDLAVVTTIGPGKGSHITGLASDDGKRS